MLPEPRTPSQLKSLHLFRALLREATYLPDQAARSYFRRYIVARFKSYHPSPAGHVPNKSPTGFKRRKPAVLDARTRPMQRLAQKRLNYLRRANQGEVSCLERVLYMTYGRMGPRRYTLLNELLRPEHEEAGASAGKQLSPLQKLYYSNRRWLEFFDAPKKTGDNEQHIEISTRYPRLKAVINSQVHKGIALGREIRRPMVVTAIRNIWERPMPIKRARNNIRRWYAYTLTRTLPPLPGEEWDRLRALANGEEKWRDFVPRRRSAKEEPEDPLEKTREDIELALALNRPSKADLPAGKERPHTITARFMQRLYSRMMRYCCKIDWNEERKKWVVIWPSPKETLPAVYTAPADDSLFSGVDNKGRLPRSTVRKEKEAATPTTGTETG